MENDTGIRENSHAHGTEGNFLKMTMIMIYIINSKLVAIKLHMIYFTGTIKRCLQIYII